MLQKHLIIHVDAKANQKNIIHWQNFRITLLDDRLFRVEFNKNKKYRDCPTQAVWFRNFADIPFSHEEHDDFILIKTRKSTLRVNKDKTIDALINNHFVRADNSDNLKGTYRTLDRCDGQTCYDNPFANVKKHHNIKLSNGVISKNGVAFFDDAKSLSINKDGEIINEKISGFDKYVFVYGNDYLSAIQALCKITGQIPMIPRFAFGNWWSRYHVYTDEEYLSILNRFEEKEVPLTVATIDIDWHYTKTLDEEFSITKLGKNTPFYGGNFGWTGYSWNKHLFPDYKDFLAKIHEKNLKITLNLHPADGIRWFEDCYNDFAKSLGKDPKTEERIQFDIANTDFINSYFKIIHKPYEHDGVDFWWIDWQQGTKSSIEGLDPLWSLNHYHYLDIGKEKEIPLILSRYSGIGSHRYPIGFSGDTFVTWKTLDYLPYFTATASNIGYTYWSHDIGGHMLGEKNDELFVRSVQFGVFSPINRLHCTYFETMSKEPWCFKNGSGLIAEEFLRLRHQLIPFLYSYSYKTHNESLPLIQPLYYKYDTPQSYDYKNEYIFGDSMIVCPITCSKGKNYFSKKKVYLPKGKWTDYFTNEFFDIEEGKEFIVYRTLDEAPVFVKAGSVIPLSKDKGNSSSNPIHLECQIFNGDGEYDLYEDSGVKNGITHFVLTNKNEIQTVRISFKGEKDVVPSSRTIKLIFKNIKNGSLDFYIDGVKQDKTKTPGDYLSIEFQFDIKKEYYIEIHYKKESRAQLLKNNALRVLLIAEEKHMDKLQLYEQILKCTKEDEIVKSIVPSNVKNETKEAILEIM